MLPVGGGVCAAAPEALHALFLDDDASCVADAEPVATSSPVSPVASSSQDLPAVRRADAVSVEPGSDEPVAVPGPLPLACDGRAADPLEAPGADVAPPTADTEPAAEPGVTTGPTTWLPAAT